MSVSGDRPWRCDPGRQFCGTASFWPLGPPNLTRFLPRKMGRGQAAVRGCVNRHLKLAREITDAETKPGSVALLLSKLLLFESRNLTG